MARKYHDIRDVLRALNPDTQVEVTKDTEKCYFGSYPTLADIRQVYGAGASEAWLAAQITDLAAFSGCSNKLDSRQIQSVSVLIANEYYFLKVSELMDFFRRFKLGKYGRFYGAVDPLIITDALRQYLIDRATVIEEHDQKVSEQREAEERKNYKPYNPERVAQIMEHYPILKQIIR